MRILHVLTDTDRRGAQVFGYELAARLEERGHEVSTVALASGTSGGLDVRTLGSGRLHPATLRALRAEMRSVDVTAAHGSTTLPACAVASLGKGRSFVYRQISDPVFWTPTRSSRARVAVYYRRAAQVVALSQSTEAIVHERFGVPQERITVIPNGVDERRCPPASANDRLQSRHGLGLAAGPTVAYVGALADEKGVADLVDAAPPGSNLLIAGDGPQRSELEARASGSSATVRFLGALDDPWLVYCAADVVVLPSRGGDTQPAVLIESALVGTACISTPVGAIPDIIQHGRNGVLVPASDVAALRRALELLLSNPAERSRLAGQAQVDAEARFAMDIVAERWEQVLLRAAVDSA